MSDRDDGQNYRFSPWTVFPAVASILTVLNLRLGGKVVTVDSRDLDVGAYVLAATAVLGLILCPTKPRLSLVVGLAASISYTLLGYPSHPGQIAVGVALGAAFVFGARREAVFVSLLAGVGALLLVPRLISEDAFTSAGRTFLFLVPTLPIVVGYIIWLHRQRVERLEEVLTLTRQAQRTGLERDSAVQRVAIARDLHDTVGHGISVIAVQSGAALSVLDTDPDAARDALVAINESCRTAMTETKQALAALRGDANARPPRVEATVLTAEATGLDVHFDQSGTLDEVEAAVADAVRRLAQESLTNTLKHASAERLDITLDVEPRSVRFRFIDIGDAVGRPGPSRGEGTGLKGMAERVAEVGGRFVAGPTETGFEVSAEMPRLGGQL